jgi:RNA recognition motif-containing protein
MRHFKSFGEINYVKIPTGKNCGFVQYTTRSAAEQAIEQMNGFLIGSSRIRLAWGRSQNEKSKPLRQTPFLPNSPSLGDDDLFLDTSYQRLGSFSPLSPPQSYRDFFSSPPLHPTFQQQQPSTLDWLMRGNQD